MMEMEKDFAKKLNWKPLINSLILGAACGTFMFILLNNNLLVGIVIGLIAFLLQSIWVYPHYLPNLYGHWKITDKSISYYDYSTWSKRIQAIFLPMVQSQVEVSFKNISSYSLVVNRHRNKWQPHYIILKLYDGHQVPLDLSWNLLKSGEPEKDVEWAVDFITSKLNQKTVQVLQI